MKKITYRKMCTYASLVPSAMLIVACGISAAIMVCDWVFVDQMSDASDPQEMVRDKTEYYKQENETATKDRDSWVPLSWIIYRDEEQPGAWLGDRIENLGDNIVKPIADGLSPVIGILTINSPLLTQLGYVGGAIRLVLITIIVLGLVDVLWIG